MTLLLKKLQMAIALTVMMSIVLAFPLSASALSQEQIVASTSPAIVLITKSDQQGRSSYGSGFIIDSQGDVLTNYHVVRNAKQLSLLHIDYKQVYTNDSVLVVAVDPIRDIALLRLVNFRGFKNADGSEGPAGAPVKLKQGSNENDIIKMGKDILTMANPDNLRRIVTKGIISGIEDAAWLFGKRKSVLGNAAYKVILFDADIAAGASGGVIVQVDSGQVVGMATGAVGSDAFSGFGIPVQYINQLLARAAQAQGHTADVFPWSQYENAEDPYYSGALYSKVVEPEDTNMITISGYVRDQYGDSISNASVQIYGYRKDLIVSQRYALTDDTGRFELSIPQAADLKWKGNVEHKYYEQQKLNVSSDVEDFSREYVLPLRKDLVQEERAFMEVFPRTVELEFGSKKVMLRANVLKGIRKDTSKMLRWKLSTNVAWLSVSRSSGTADSIVGDKIELHYGDSDGDGSADKPPKPGEANLYIQPADDNGSQEKWGLVLVKVFANKKSGDEPIMVSGYVESPYGGLPQWERVTITPYVGDQPIGSSEHVDEFGRFQFPVDRQYEGKKIRLKAQGLVFKVVNNEDSSMYVDSSNDWRTMITMKPRN